MKFDITHDGRTTLAVDYAGAIHLGYPAAKAGAALRAVAHREVTTFADEYRAAIATTAPGKIAEWLFKERIARDRENARPEELAILDREAAARGIDRDSMLALILAKANAFREIALLIGAIEAEAKATIADITDDADNIETQIQTALMAAKAQAKTAFNEALTLINGGS